MDLTNAKILVVDDEPDILEFVSYNLKNEGCIVYTSNNGDDAILQATRIKVGAVWMRQVPNTWVALKVS